MDAETAGSLVTFAEEARIGLTGLDGASVQTELEDRRRELLAAIEWFVERGRPDEAFRLAGALVPFWMATKRIDEGDASVERVLSLPGGSRPARARARGQAMTAQEGVEHAASCTCGSGEICYFPA